MNQIRMILSVLIICSSVINLDAQTNRFELKLASPVLQVATTLATQDTPTAVFNSILNKYFVVWAHRVCDPRGGCHANVRGRFVNENGSMSPERVYSSPLDQGEVFQIRLAYNSQLNNYLLTWFGEIGTSSGLFSRVISANGTPGSRRLAAQTTSADAITYQPAINQYLVSSSGYLLLSSQGQAMGQPVNPSGPDFFPLIFPDPSGGFTVLAERNRRVITMQKISQSGQLQGSSVNVFSKKPNDFELFSAAYNPLRNQYLLSIGGELTPSGKREVKTLLIDNSGRVLSTPRTVATKTADSFTITRNAIAFVDRGYLIAYLRDGHLWIRPLDLFGRPAAKEIRVTQVTATHVEVGILYDFSLDRAFVTWQRTLGQAQDIHARFVEWVR